MKRQAAGSRRAWQAAGAVLTLGSLALAGCGQGTSGDNNTAPAGNTPEGNSGGNATTTSSNVKLNGAGSTFINPIASKWFDEYNKKTGVQINYQPIGSGGGIKQWQSGTVDFAASDAPLDDKDLKSMPGAVVQLPMVAGAVVISYNLPALKQPLKLDGPTTANIFLGKIKTWNDPAIAKLNAGATLPSLPITVAHRSDGSGTTFIFTNYLKSVSPEWASQIGAGKSVKWPNGQIGAAKNSGVAAIIKQKPGNVGYLELAYAKQSNISYAWLKNKAGQVVEPTVKSTTAAAAGSLAALQKDVRTSIANADGADAYPIAGFTYILLSKQQRDADKGKALTDFLKWAITDGQQDAEALFYAPLPPELVAVNQKAIDSVK